MRSVLLVTLALLAPLVLEVRAADAPPAEFVQAMKEAAAFLSDMRAPGSETDFEKTKKYVPIVRDAFAVVERYWLDRNQEGQYFKDIALAEEMIKLASDMGVAANLQSAEGVRWAVQTLGERCATCHDARRERGPNGFLIRN